MAVDTPHFQHADMTERWHKCRTTVAGEEAVKAAKEEFLPVLSGQDDDDYRAYLKRAAYFNATARTVDGLSGMIFRKAPIITAPEAMDDFLDDVTLDGVAFNAFAEKTVDEVLTVGRAGIIVDFPRDDAGVGVRTVAEASALKLRPFLRLYRAEDIINWRIGLVGNQSMLVQVRLTEAVEEVADDDEFTTTTVDQIRVLDLDDTGFYRQRIFRLNTTTRKWEQYGDDIVPEMNGARMAFIPFTFVGPMDTASAVSKPPLIDLANTNLSHYRTSADMEHGAHYVGLPTPYVWGIREEEIPTTIGPEKVWAGSSTDVQVGMLEFTGQGLGSIEKLLDRKEGQMAILGARMLFPEKKAVEAAETASMHRQGENSSLASLTLAVARALGEALTIARDWMGLQGDIAVTLNTDYFPAPMTAQALTALVGAVQAGVISQDTFFDNLQRGEIIAADRTFEDEMADIQTAPPPGMGADGFGFDDSEDDDTIAADG